MRKRLSDVELSKSEIWLSMTRSYPKHPMPFFRPPYPFPPTYYHYSSSPSFSPPRHPIVKHRRPFLSYHRRQKKEEERKIQYLYILHLQSSTSTYLTCSPPYSYHLPTTTTPRHPPSTTDPTPRHPRLWLVILLYYYTRGLAPSSIYSTSTYFTCSLPYPLDFYILHFYVQYLYIPHTSPAVLLRLLGLPPATSSMSNLKTIQWLWVNFNDP